MKNFLTTFLAVLVLLWAFLFFGGTMILGNLWGAMALCALVLTALIRTLESQGDRIEALEQRIQALEQAREHNAGEIAPGEEEESV